MSVENSVYYVCVDGAVAIYVSVGSSIQNSVRREIARFKTHREVRDFYLTLLEAVPDLFKSYHVTPETFNQAGAVSRLVK